MTELRSPVRGTVYELTEDGIVTKYKRSLPGLKAWFLQQLCQHPNHDQKVDDLGILCRKCGWARAPRRNWETAGDPRPKNHERSNE